MTLPTDVFMRTLMVYAEPLCFQVEDAFLLAGV